MGLYAPGAAGKLGAETGTVFDVWPKLAVEWAVLGGLLGSDPDRKVGANGAMVIVPEPAMLCFVPTWVSAAEAVAALVKETSAPLCGEGTGFLLGIEIGEVDSYFGGLTGPTPFSWKYGSDAVLAEAALRR